MAEKLGTDQERLRKVLKDDLRIKGLTTEDTLDRAFWRAAIKRVNPGLPTQAWEMTVSAYDVEEEEEEGAANQH